MPTVMIAENDLMVADMLHEVLIVGGYTVCGIAQTVADGIMLAERHKPDLALLDVRLAAGGLGTEIAAGIDRNGGVGILYTTGNVGTTTLTKADGDACLRKPYRPAEIVRALAIVTELIHTGRASGPFPRTFQLLEPSLAQAVVDIGKPSIGRTPDVIRLLR
jgi:CheY-like chemotaxis protein